MFICSYGDHTHTHTRAHIHIHTQFCLVCSSTFSCLEQTGIEPDQTGSDGKPRETSLIFIFLIVCLRYSGILNPRFLIMGPFFFFLQFFWTFCLSLGSENWTFEDWTGPDRLVQRAYEREKRLKNDQSDWRQTYCHSLSVHMTNRPSL